MINEGWKEAAIAWEVCASIHREYAKGKDALFKTRQNDFVNAANKARVKAQAPTPPVHAENTSAERVRSEADLWVWQYSNGTFSSMAFKNRRACELNTLPNAAGQPVALYLHPPTLRMPEPMTPNDINVAAGSELAGLLDHIYEHSTTSEGVMPLAVAFARAIEAEVLRRLKEANK